MTVYRRFGSKDALVDALTVREARRCLTRIAAAIDPRRPIADRLTDLFIVVLGVIREHPLLERLARVEPEALLRELTRNDSAAFALVREFLIGLLSADELPNTEPALLAELAVRLGASFVLMPSSLLPLDDERALRAAVGPLVESLTI